MSRIASFFAFCLLCCAGYAQPLQLAAGITVEPPEQVELTYQIIPSYDEKAKVLAAWDGDKLKYFVDVSELPPGYLNARTYLSAFATDLRKAWKNLEIGRQGSYKSAHGMSASMVELVRPAAGNDERKAMVVHHLNDGKRAFLVTVSLIPPVSAETAMAETVAIFKTAAVSAEKPAAQESNETPLVGLWTIEETLPDGRVAIAKWDLRADKTFAAEVRVGDRPIFAASGAWFINGGVLYSTYINSSPELPQDQRLEEDQILRIEGDVVTLKSSKSGKQRTMKRLAVFR